MTEKSRRVLWLINHTTLRESEVPLLVKLGFEVYTPKKFKYSIVNRSGTVEYKYDETLTIPSKLLKKMNAVDFYQDNWSASLRNEINNFFGTAICGFFPRMVDMLAENFEGKVLLRAFGIAGDLPYSEWFNRYCQEKTIQKVQCEDRFFFSPSYQNIIFNEPTWLREKSVFLPLGLPAKLVESKDKWNGQANQILFVCPNINDYNYYKKFYKEFKANFSQLPHIIAGLQPVPVDDPAVTGFLPDEQYRQLMVDCRVMFYHSREQTHLHYHPLEAILAGMPLIYMSGGMLDYLAGEKLPGCCDNYLEAVEKTRRILNGEEGFIREVRQSQLKLLEPFSTEFIEQIWRQNFLPLVTTTSKPAIQSADPEPNLHLGIWIHLAIPWAFGVEGIMRLLAFLIENAQDRGNVKISIACASWVKSELKYYLEQLGVATRRVNFIVVSERPPLLYHIYKLIMAWSTPAAPNRFRVLLKTIKSVLATVKKQLSDVSKKITIDLKRLVLPIFSTRSILVWFFALLVGLLLSPLLLASLLALGLGRIIGRLPGWVFSKSAQWRKRLSKDKGRYRIRVQAQRVFNEMAESELKQLAKLVNATHTDIDCWFFPYPHNSNIDLFKRPVVIAVPDVVYFDFPISYSLSNPGMITRHNELVNTVKKATATISYSDFVRQNHIVKRGFRQENGTYVIPHAPVPTRNLLTIQENLSHAALIEKSKNIILNFLTEMGNSKYLENDPVVRYRMGLPFGSFHYFFISSQSRNHKNYLNLFRAYEMILRERFINAKLIITGELWGELRDFVDQKNLHFDILSCTNLPPRVHAAFYTCATVTIVPTLFEGGFPFNFSESLSCGTPVIMSDIPVVREVLPDSCFDPILFDPYSIEDIADKMAYAITNREKVLEFESKIYQDLKKRTWTDVMNEYFQVFRSVSKSSAKKQNNPQ